MSIRGPTIEVMRSQSLTIQIEPHNLHHELQVTISVNIKTNLQPAKSRSVSGGFRFPDPLLQFRSLIQWRTFVPGRNRLSEPLSKVRAVTVKYSDCNKAYSMCMMFRTNIRGHMGA